jgi:type III pantothenate kinase
MSLLVIDVGNTHTVIGVFESRKLRADWRMETSSIRNDDELRTSLEIGFREAGIREGDIDAVVISSVVPNLTGILELTATKYLRVSPTVISAVLDIGMPIRYENPNAVGADRLCNAVAAFAKYGGPCIAVDFGTATTFDAVSSRGEYLGGVIAPGIETASIDLQKRAALLPKIELQFPAHVIGTNTVASMQSGILYGAIDAMEGMVKRIKGIVGDNAPVVATGGFSKLMASKSRAIDHVEPHLVLEGAMLIHERITKKKS